MNKKQIIRIKGQPNQKRGYDRKRGKMIVTIDVGNTNITVGVFRDDEVIATFRMTTKMPRTSDEYGMLLVNLLEQNDIHCQEIEDAIIASVVPNVMHSLEGAVIKYLNIQPESASGQKIRARLEQTESLTQQRPMSSMVGRYWFLISGRRQPTILWMRPAHLFPVSPHRVSAFLQKHSGRMPQSSLRLKSKNRTAFLQRKPSQVCRQGLYTDRLDRRSTLSA